jgi:hypothetical protein
MNARRRLDVRLIGGRFFRMVERSALFSFVVERNTAQPAGQGKAQMMGTAARSKGFRPRICSKTLRAAPS